MEKEILEKVETGFNDINTKIGNIESTINIYQQTINSLVNLDKKYDGFAKENNLYVDGLNTTLTEMKQELNQLKDGINTNTGNVRVYNEKLDTYNDKLNEVSDNVKGMGSSLTKMTEDLETFFVDTDGTRTNIAIATHTLLENTYSLLESSVNSLKENYRTILSQSEELLTKVDSLSGSLGEYHDDVMSTEELLIGGQNKENTALANQGDTMVRVIEASHGKEPSDNTITKQAMLFYAQFADQTAPKTYMSNVNAHTLNEGMGQSGAGDTENTRYLEANETARTIIGLNQAIKEGSLSKEEALVVKNLLTGGQLGTDDSDIDSK